MASVVRMCGMKALDRAQGTLEGRSHVWGA